MTCLQARLSCGIYVPVCRAEAGLMRVFTTELKPHCPACGDVSVVTKGYNKVCAVCGRKSINGYSKGLCPQCMDKYGETEEGGTDGSDDRIH